MRNRLFAALLAGGLLASGLAGAIPASAQVSGSVYVQVGPPAPQVEVIPANPGGGYVWQAGYWRWNGYRYVWVGGRYVTAPYGGALWVPGHWRHTYGGWVWVPGHWR